MKINQPTTKKPKIPEASGNLGRSLKEVLKAHQNMNELPKASAPVMQTKASGISPSTLASLMDAKDKAASVERPAMANLSNFDNEVEEVALVNRNAPSKPTPPLPSINSNIPRLKTYRTQETPKGFVRLELPSRCVPYSFDSVSARPLNVGDIISVISAGRDLTGLLDALAPALNQDIRDLTAGDLRFLMYWWQRNSLPATPYTINWVSRYGNRCKSVVNTSTLKPVELKMTRDEYAVFRSKGIIFPSLRDAEAIDTIDLTPPQRFLAERAQYVYVDENDIPADVNPMTYRMEVLSSMPLSFLEDVREFSKLVDHGINETLSVVDENFDPKTAVSQLRKGAADLTVYISEMEDRREVEVITDKIRDMLDEADEIEALLPKMEADPLFMINPRKESVVVNLTPQDFFSEI